MALERRGASAYLEVFVLVALALGGSGIVFAAGLGVASSAQGPGVSVYGFAVRQGAYFAVESATVYDVGDAPFTFVLSTSGVSTAASYCYTVYSPEGGATVSTTCPAMSTDPARVPVATALSPGGGVVVELTIAGTAFSLGTDVKVTVTTSTGAQQSADAEVVPA